jgi:FdhD protein
MSELATDVTVFRVDLRTRTVERKGDSVATEAPLHVFFNQIHLVSILSSPTMLKELVIGHLLGEGLIRSVNEVADVEFTEGNRCIVSLREIDAEDRVIVSRPFARLMLSACGTSGYKSLSELLESLELKALPSWQVKGKILLDCIKQLNTSADTFRTTGGVHVAALFRQNGALVVLAEDVGRHNAVDKVVGAAALRGEQLDRCFLGLSGRLTADIVLKAARVGIPIVASLAAAIDSGVVVAERAKMTLVGFARGQRMNIYTCPERIIV